INVIRDRTLRHQPLTDGDKVQILRFTVTQCIVAALNRNKAFQYGHTPKLIRLLNGPGNRERKVSFVVLANHVRQFSNVKDRLSRHYDESSVRVLLGWTFVELFYNRIVR